MKDVRFYFVEALVFFWNEHICIFDTTRQVVEALRVFLVVQSTFGIGFNKKYVFFYLANLTLIIYFLNSTNINLLERLILFTIKNIQTLLNWSTETFINLEFRKFICYNWFLAKFIVLLSLFKFTLQKLFVVIKFIEIIWAV